MRQPTDLFAAALPRQRQRAFVEGSGHRMAFQPVKRHRQIEGVECHAGLKHLGTLEGHLGISQAPLPDQAMPQYGLRSR